MLAIIAIIGHLIRLDKINNLDKTKKIKEIQAQYKSSIVYKLLVVALLLESASYLFSFLVRGEFENIVFILVTLNILVLVVSFPIKKYSYGFLALRLLYGFFSGFYTYTLVEHFVFKSIVIANSFSMFIALYALYKDYNFKYHKVEKES